MKNELLEFALMLADSAEAEIMPRFRNCAVNWKPDGSEVTDADRRAEDVMREVIARHFPTHAVLGEEHGGPAEPTNEPLWMLDPIDGTASFALGLPIFGTLIGFVDHGEPQLGVIHLPAMSETIYAARGAGCWSRLRGQESKPCVVSGVKDLHRAFVSTMGFDRRHNLQALFSKARKSRCITDCVQHALVAQGRIDAAIDSVMHPWDIAALVPCVEEAGGVITDLNGVRKNIAWRTSILSAASADLHKEILNSIRVST